jgi:hypothetical protein
VACTGGRCASGGATGFAALACVCQRPLPAGCVADTVPRRVLRPFGRACGAIGKVPGASGKKIVRLIRRAERQFGRAARLAAGRAGRAAGVECASALAAAFDDGADRAALLRRK